MQEKLGYYSVLIEWEENHPDSGLYGWLGWARSESHAVELTRKAMAQAEPELTEKLPLEDVGGEVLEIVEGGGMWQAGAAAIQLERLIDADQVPTRDDLKMLLSILRP
ncbi:MAG: hypothetical protein ACU0BO_11085 [Limimaricola soesokkakensis]|uniref:hypothetical protein n=1 Tax=Limimaricola soesokkakensis TaxID=1343159 RepID=UPI0040594181